MASSDRTQFEDRTGPSGGAEEFSSIMACFVRISSDIRSDGAGQGQQDTATITLSMNNKPPAGETSRWREVRDSINEDEPEEANNVKRNAGRPIVKIDIRILEAIIKFDAEGHPWPRICALLEPISKRYGGPYPLHVEQVRRLAVKAAQILGVKLIKRRHGRPWAYYRQFKKAGGGL